MEEITLSYEQSFMREYHAGETPCMYMSKCVGKTFRDLRGSCCHVIFPAFVTPMNHTAFDNRCVLCLRRDITREFYSILYNNETPQSSIIHPYTVKVDKQGEYDADSCLFPPICNADGQTRFVGLIGPFPRFDAFTLRVNLNKKTIEQQGLMYHIVPTINKPFKRQGARRIDFFYNTTAAILLAGYICNVAPSLHIDVVDIYKKCIPKRNNQRLAIGDYENSTTTTKWLTEINSFTRSGIYKNFNTKIVDTGDTSELTLAVQEHIVFLISNDELLNEAVIRKFPQWPSFVKYTEKACDVIRQGKSLQKIQRVYLTSNNSDLLNRIIRYKNWKLRAYSPHVPEVYERLKRLPNIEKEIDNLLVSEYDDFATYVGGLIYQHAFLRVLLPLNRQVYESFVYTCMSCHSFKSHNDNDGTFMSHSQLAVDWAQKDLFCVVKDLTGRKAMKEHVKKRRLNGEGEGAMTITAKKNSCPDPLIRITLGSHVAHINGVCKARCLHCLNVCDFSIRNIMYGTVCDKCAKKKLPARCVQCGSLQPHTRNSWMQIEAFKDGGLSGCQPVWFCKRHSFQCTTLVKYWSLPILLEKVNSIFVKKTTKKSQKT